MDLDMELPDRDYVRVLAVVPKNPNRDWLVKAAQALQREEPWAPDQGFDLGLPQEFVYDESYLAVAMGKTYPESDNVSPVDFVPKNSEYFVIRGFVKTTGLEAIPRTIDDLEIFSDPNIGAALTCGTDPAVGSVVDVGNKLDFAKLWAAGLNGDRVAVAIVDSGIYLPFLDPKRKERPRAKYPLSVTPKFDGPNSWGPLIPRRLATPPGLHRIGHGTMCAYNVLAAAPKATLLDYPVLIARAPGDHTAKGTASAAIHAYSKLLTFWINNLAGKKKYKALVVNNSWTILHPCLDFPTGSPNRFIDNLNHPFHFLVQVLVKLKVDIVFAAGNGGLPCPAPPFLHLTTGSIRGGSAYLEVLTVAGCDLTDRRVGYSSQGKSIAMYPLPPQEKPDLTAYTHFLGSQVFGPREPDRGTSTSCPIAAGCVAALRTKLPATGTPPADLFLALKTKSRQVGAPGWNRDYGYGIIDPVAAGRSLGLSIP